MAETTELLQISISLKTFVGVLSSDTDARIGSLEPELDINKEAQLDVKEQQWMREKVDASAVDFALTLPSTIPNTPQVFYFETSESVQVNVNSTGYVQVDDFIVVMAPVTSVTVTNDITPVGETGPVDVTIKYGRFGLSS